MWGCIWSWTKSSNQYWRQVIQKKVFYQKYLECDHSDIKHTQDPLRSSTCEMLLKNFDIDVCQPCQKKQVIESTRVEKNEQQV